MDPKFGPSDLESRLHMRMGYVSGSGPDSPWRRYAVSDCSCYTVKCDVGNCSLVSSAGKVLNVTRVTAAGLAVPEKENV